VNDLEQVRDLRRLSNNVKLKYKLSQCYVVTYLQRVADVEMLSRHP